MTVTLSISNSSSIATYAHQAYESAVHLYGGGDRAHLVVGNLALALILVVTCVGAWYVLREVYVVGLKLIKIIVTSAAVLLLGAWTAQIYTFVYPNDAAKAGAQEAARDALDSSVSFIDSLHTWYFATP